MVSDRVQPGGPGRLRPVLMHLMVLGAFWPARAIQPGRPPASVLMHLMALGAFWPSSSVKRLTSALSGLNAPYGARCFLTDYTGIDDLPLVDRLNAPYRARCFLT